MRRAAVPLLAAPLLAGCSGTEEGAQEPLLGPFPDRVVVTADWLNRTLTIFDHARLISGAHVADARWSTVDLAAYPPGPLEVELTPDGRTAVVAVGSGFFPAIGALFLGPIDVPPGGALLVVDLPSRSVRAEVRTAHVPMGVAIAPDGAEAFTANFGEAGEPGSTVSRINIESGAVIEEIELPGRPEQISLNADGSLGMVSVDGEGSIRTFDPADLTGTISTPVLTSGDPSGVALVDGVPVGVVANSLDPLGYSTIDVSEPLSPALIETVTMDFGVPFAASRIPGTAHALLGGATGAPATLVRLDCGAAPAAVVDTIPLGNEKGGFALGAAVDREGEHAFVAIPGDNILVVVELEAGTTRSLQWLSGMGPTYAAVAP